MSFIKLASASIITPMNAVYVKTIEKSKMSANGSPVHLPLVAPYIHISMCDIKTKVIHQAPNNNTFRSIFKKSTSSLKIKEILYLLNCIINSDRLANCAYSIICGAVISGLSVEARASLLVSPIEYHRTTYDYEFITFETGFNSTVVSSIPGGYPGVAYYDRASIHGVEFQSVAGNSNKPGFTTLSNWSVHQGTFDFYNVGTGNFVIPGLGVGINDSIVINFSNYNKPVYSFAAKFGSVQEPTPCCVQQLMTVSLSDGQELKFLLSATGEKSHNDVVGYTSNGSAIKSIQLDQLGHNATLDDVTIGSTKNPYLFDVQLDLHSLPDVKDQLKLAPSSVQDDLKGLKAFGAQAGKSRDNLNTAANIGQNIPADIVNGPKSAAQGYVTDKIIESSPHLAQKPVSLLNRIFSALRSNGATEVAELYKSGGTGASKAGAKILDLYANDPPRFDYKNVDYPESEVVGAGFASLFGQQYDVFDRFFAAWGKQLSALYAGLVAIERAQGALVDGDAIYYEIQKDHFLKMLDAAQAASEEMRAFQNAMEPLISALNRQGVSSFHADLGQAFSLGLIEEYLQALLTAGFTEDEIAKLRLALLPQGSDIPIGTLSFADFFEGLGNAIYDSSPLALFQGAAGPSISVPAPQSSILMMMMGVTALILVRIRRNIRTLSQGG